MGVASSGWLTESARYEGRGLTKCRAILVRWDNKAENDRGLLTLACGLLWYRRSQRGAARPEARRPPSTAAPSASAMGGPCEHLDERFPL